jgi:hypothetical protein
MDATEGPENYALSPKLLAGKELFRARVLKVNVTDQWIAGLIAPVNFHANPDLEGGRVSYFEFQMIGVSIGVGADAKFSGGRLGNGFLGVFETSRFPRNNLRSSDLNATKPGGPPVAVPNASPAPADTEAVFGIAKFGIKIALKKNAVLVTQFDLLPA